jgi:hypothetical protein
MLPVWVVGHPTQETCEESPVWKSENLKALPSHMVCCAIYIHYKQFRIIFCFPMWIGNKNSRLFTNIYSLRLITTIVHMPFYINFVQEMISIKLGLKNNKEIIV